MEIHDPPGTAARGRRSAADGDRTPWGAVLALACGIFAMITVEELPIGVLTLVRDDVGISEGVVGLMVTVAGVIAGVVSVVTPLFVGRLDRRLVLVAALGVMTASTLASALARDLWTLLASRILAGIAIGLFWALVAVAAARISAPRDRARALTVVFGGASMAVVFGVPLATLLGAALGWRWAFVAVGGLGVLVATALWFLLPPVAAPDEVGPAALRRAFALPGVRLGVLITFCLVIGQFTAYTYLSPILQDRAGIGVAEVGVMLLIFGLAGFVGNAAAGPVIRRNVGLALVLTAAGVIAGVLVVEFLAAGRVTAAASMVLWGLFGGAIGVVAQGWVMHAAGDLVEPATALNSGAFNSSIAFGALLGGQVADGVGMGAVIPVAVVVSAVALVASTYATVRHS